MAGTDPADVVSLVEALEDPGTLAYSEQALERFRALAREIRTLRRYVGEPLLDLVRRVIDVTGLDVELGVVDVSRWPRRGETISRRSSTRSRRSPASTATPRCRVCSRICEAEEEYAQGLALAIPTEANSVKLLTVHRAKGLEWDVVFVPAVCAKVFPSCAGPVPLADGHDRAAVAAAR
ncbi:MAG: 3'-5' exonuclease [Nocardioidaceae bacterium]